MDVRSVDDRSPVRWADCGLPGGDGDPIRRRRHHTRRCRHSPWHNLGPEQRPVDVNPAADALSSITSSAAKYSSSSSSERVTRRSATESYSTTWLSTVNRCFGNSPSTNTTHSSTEYARWLKPAEVTVSGADGTARRKHFAQHRRRNPAETHCPAATTLPGADGVIPRTKRSQKQQRTSSPTRWATLLWKLSTFAWLAHE